ncbi:MAG: DUF3617 domain-containing protein [Phenylobacterium sp.]
MGRRILVCGVLLSGAALALAGCSKPADKAASGAPAAGSAATPAAAVAPAGPPAPKAGLWEQTIASDQMHQTMKMCLGEPAEQKAKWWGGDARHSDCAEQRVTPRVGGGWDIHAVCQGPDGTKIATDGSATGDFGGHYHVEMTAVTTGSPMPQANGAHKMAIDSAWKGPCPAGMKPGDMEMPGGMRISTGGAGPAGSSTSTSIVTKFDANHPPSQADIARMRAQAMEMAKSMKGEAK